MFTSFLLLRIRFAVQDLYSKMNYLFFMLKKSGRLIAGVQKFDATGSPQLTTIIEPGIMVVSFCGHKSRHPYDLKLFFRLFTALEVNTVVVKRIHSFERAVFFLEISKKCKNQQQIL